MNGMHPRGSQICIHSSVHEVRTACAMSMHIDESWRDIKFLGIYDLSTICRDIFCSEIIDDPVLKHDITDERFSAGDYCSVNYLYQVHNRLWYHVFSLLRFGHTRPPGVKVSDAEYAYFGDPLAIYPNPDATRAYFAHLEGTPFGISRTQTPYNRSSPIRDEEQEEEAPSGQSPPTTE